MWSRPIEWEGPQTRRILVSFLQGVFDSSGEVVEEEMRVKVTQEPQFARTVFSYLKEVGAFPEWISLDPPSIAVSVEKAAAIPLFSPKRKTEAYRRVMQLRKMGRTARARPRNS